MAVKFSIITPSFNQGKYIKDTIESVLNQNVSNVEHIIVDNISTDNTIEILDQYKHLIRVHEKDSGPANALNKGFKIAKGEIIAWINADDYYAENIFKDIQNIFESNDKIEFICGNITFVDEKKNILINDKTKNLNYYFLTRISPESIRQPSSFFRRELLEKSGYLDESIKVIFDYDLFVRMFKITEPYLYNRTLAFYRNHSETLTRKHQKKQILEVIKISRRYGAKLYDKIIIRYIYRYIKFILGIPIE